MTAFQRSYNPATSTKSICTPVSRVLRIELMAVFTKFFIGVFVGNRVAAQNVFGSIYGLKVLGIYATAIFAQMINFKPFGYCANGDFPRNSVSVFAKFADLKSAITAAIFMRDPNPARIGFLDLFPKSSFNAFARHGCGYTPGLSLGKERMVL